MKDDLGIRMKSYESVSDQTLVRKVPVVGRIDGKAFHTLTLGMKQPWDDNLVACMNAAAVALCKETQGCSLAYYQSDEISLLITDTSSRKAQPWFNYELRKMCSIAAATATAAFCVEYSRRFPERWGALLEGNGPLPRFDARFWNIPEYEVPNYFIWRQIDAIRNSRQMFGRSYFSHGQLLNKSSQEICKMVRDTYGVDWESLDGKYKFGTLLSKHPVVESISITDLDGYTKEVAVERKYWMPESYKFDYQSFVDSFMK